MDSRKDNVVSPSPTAFSASSPELTSHPAPSQPTSDRYSPGLAHPHPGSHPHHPNRTGHRQAGAPIQRESQHYPMAERCMCSSCHLSAKLFPRTDDGRIVLPIVPVHPTHGGNIVCSASGSNLAQYMLAPSDEHSGHHWARSTSNATNSTTMTSMSYGGDTSPQFDQQSQPRPRRPTTSNRGTAQRLAYAHQTSYLPSETRDRRAEDHLVRQLDGDEDPEMKSLNPVALIGPGVAGTHSHSSPQLPLNTVPQSRSRHHRPPPQASPPPTQQHRPGASSRQGAREYNTTNHEVVMKVSVNRPTSGTYTGPPLPPHPPVAPMASLTINPSAGRGRPKGKAKAKALANQGDELSEGGSSTRNSPMSGVLSHPQIGNIVPDALMSVDKSVGLSSSTGESFGQVDLAPCKPRRGRPPRHEVVPGMGEFTVFL